MSMPGTPMLLTMDEEPLSPVKAYRIITAAPEVKVLMATPVSIMLVFIMIWKYPMKIPMTTPTAIPQTRASQMFFVYALTSTPVRADMIMVLSMVMLVTPPFLAIREDRLAKIRGVETRIMV